MAEIQARQQEHAQQAEIDKEKMKLEREKLAADIMMEHKKNQIKMAELTQKKAYEDSKMKHEHFVTMADLHHRVHQPRQGAKH
jgi:hypothetical protein